MPTLEPFRFLHTGDLHLDSPFAGLSSDVPADVSAVLRGSTLAAWERIVRLALDAQVDFMVVAGDVFEHANRTLLAQIRFRDGLARLGDAGIESFVVTGNHDPLSGWEPSIRWPVAMYRFGADAVEARPVVRRGREIARVYGISYGVRDVTENLAARFTRDDDAPFAIGLLHANVGGQPGHLPYAPCTLTDLRAAALDYWALGHIHRRFVLSAGDPTVVYCGNPQGRDPGETDPRGVYVVDVDSRGRAEPVFHATDVVRWQTLEVPIGGLEGEEALLDAIGARVERAQAEAGRSVVARVTLTGAGPLHRSLQRPGLLDQTLQLARERLVSADGFAWIESLRDASRLSVDAALSGPPGTFLGELIAEAQTARELLSAPLADEASEDEAALAAAGWGEVTDDLYAHRRLGRILRGRRPGRERLAELLAEAERLAVDRLIEAD